jgi:hypothetical protein
MHRKKSMTVTQVVFPDASEGWLLRRQPEYFLFLKIALWYTIVLAFHVTTSSIWVLSGTWP